MSNVLCNSRPLNPNPPRPSTGTSIPPWLPSPDTWHCHFTPSTGPNQGGFFKKGRLMGHSHFHNNQSCKNNRKETQGKSTEAGFPYTQTHLQTQISTRAHTVNSETSKYASNYRDVNIQSHNVHIMQKYTKPSGHPDVPVSIYT